jgi:hypothetical protein
MGKICPKCRSPQSDPKLILCDKCHVSFINDEHIAQYLDKDQINAIAGRLVRLPLFWALMLVSLILASVPVGSVLGRVFAKKIERATSEMTNLITQAFGEPKIGIIISNVAATYATNVLIGQVGLSVSNFQAELNSKLIGVENALQTFQSNVASNLTQLNTLSEFGLALSRAANDDRNAFKIIIQGRESTNQTIRKLAHDAVTEIVQKLESEHALSWTWSITERFWRDSPVKLTNATMQELIGLYSSSSAVTRMLLLRSIHGQERLPLRDRLDFIAAALNEEVSVRCAGEACQLINERAKLDLNILGCQAYLTWWSSNRNAVLK